MADAPIPQWPKLDLTPRARLGRFEVVAKLGQGGMADVFLAVARGPHSDFHKVVVVKRLRVSLRGDPDVERMFLEEARIAARLSHPHVVHTYSIDTDDDGHQLLVMEYLEGVSLGALCERLMQGSLAERLTLMGAVSDALEGLHYFHEFTDYDQTPMGLVHRDIKPDNVFVTFDGQVKLVDFGIAKAMATDNEATASLVVKGTARYMAPEMVGRAREVDHRADLCSVGVILWELASGKRLWEGVDALHILKRLADNEVPGIDADDEVPDELARICRRALQTEPAQRYPTAAALKRDLDAFLDSHDASPRTQALANLAVDQFGDIRTKRAHAIQARLDDIVSEYTDNERVSVSSPATDPAPDEATALLGAKPAHRRRGPWLALAGLAGLGVATTIYLSTSTRPTPSESPAPDSTAAPPAPAEVTPVGTERDSAEPPAVEPLAPEPPAAESAESADVVAEETEVVEQPSATPVTKSKQPKRPDSPPANADADATKDDETADENETQEEEKEKKKNKGLALDREAPWGK